MFLVTKIREVLRRSVAKMETRDLGFNLVSLSVAVGDMELPDEALVRLSILARESDDNIEQKKAKAWDGNDRPGVQQWQGES